MHSTVISVVIPAYNEEETIGNVIEETSLIMNTLGMPYEIIVVDDGSTDRTREVVSRYKVTMLSNGKNQGKGYAVRKGILHSESDIIVTIDADGSHNPKEIPDLINPLFNGTDMVAGSRLLGQEKDHTTKLKIVGNNLINMAIMILTWKKITDSQTGFRAFKRKILQEINLKSSGYEIETEITVKGLRNGFVFQEKPISCKKRNHDFSKIRVLYDGMKIFTTMLQARFT